MEFFLYISGSPHFSGACMWIYFIFWFLCLDALRSLIDWRHISVFLFILIYFDIFWFYPLQCSLLAFPLKHHARGRDQVNASYSINPNSLDNKGSCWILLDFYCSVTMLRELGLSITSITHFSMDRLRNLWFYWSEIFQMFCHFKNVLNMNTFKVDCLVWAHFQVWYVPPVFTVILPSFSEMLLFSLEHWSYPFWKENKYFEMTYLIITMDTYIAPVSTKFDAHGQL